MECFPFSDLRIFSLYIYIYIYIYISCSILKKESKLTFENVPTMSLIQSTEILGELLFSQLLDSFLEIYRDLLQKNGRSDVSM